MSEEREGGWPHGPDPESHVVMDAKGLRALAHPVRVQVLGLLRRTGPSTATRLAERMGLTSGATSYHLRQLAAAGFVVEDEERGNARDRWWKAAHRTTWWRDMSLADEEPEATLTFWQSVVAANAQTAQRALGAYTTMPQDWRHAFDLSDWLLRLTPEEARGLSAELLEVINRYRRDDPEATAELPENSARVSLIVQLLPDPETTGTADEDEDRTRTGTDDGGEEGS
ncbi:ArsR/SmtB family transcription factor [Kitasatospora sp. NPDC004240]